MGMRRLKDCTEAEIMVLMALMTLAAQLPRDLVDYTHSLGELREKYFSTKAGARGEHNPSGRSLAKARSIRATERYGR